MFGLCVHNDLIVFIADPGGDQVVGQFDEDRQQVSTVSQVPLVIDWLISHDHDRLAMRNTDEFFNELTSVAELDATASGMHKFIIFVCHTDELGELGQFFDQMAIFVETFGNLSSAHIANITFVCDSPTIVSSCAQRSC
jgi:hypothetical protein